MKAKIKIMKTKPEVTDEEILKSMDFDQLIAKHRSTRKQSGTKKSAIIGSTIIALLMGISVYKYTSEQNIESNLPKNQTEHTPSVNSEKAIPQEEVKPPEVRVEKKESIKESESQEEHLQKPNHILVPDSNVSTVLVSRDAEPVEGFQHLYEYFNSELKYPEEAVRDSIQGVVMVSFIINKEGDPEQITIIRSMGPAFDKEAYRLIENMPKWKPALMNGKPAPSKISLPLTFRIEP